MSVLRDHDRELRLLAAAGGAGPAAYVEAVAERLDAGQQLYGDRWASRPLVELLRETREEAQDIGAWGVLAVQATDEIDLTAPDRAGVVRHLKRAMALAAKADAELRAALDIATLQTDRAPRTAGELACELLRVHLPADGRWHLCEPIKAAVSSAGHMHPRTVERAAKTLGVHTDRIHEPHARGIWRWPVPTVSVTTTGRCRCKHGWPSDDGYCFRCRRAIQPQQ